MNFIQSLVLVIEDDKRKDILDGGLEYYKATLRSQETRSVPKSLPPSAFEPLKQYFICLF